MALNKSEGANIVFLSVADGHIVQQHKEKTKFTVERVTKTGKLVHEEKFRDLTGYLINISTRENDYGKQWSLFFKDGEDTYVVQLPYSSRYSSSFIKALPNIDKSRPIKFMPWSMADKNDASKKITGVTLYQNDGNGFIKVLPAFTKDNPNGIPDMKKIKVKGKETWDDSDMMDFLENVVNDFLNKDGVAEGTNEEEVPF